MAVRGSQLPICFVTFALLAAGVMSLSFVVRVDSPDPLGSALPVGEQQPPAAVDDQATASARAEDTVQAERRVIVYLKSRHHIMAVYSSEDGPRFGLSLADGTQLAGDLSEAELRDRYPNLFQFYWNSYAGAWAGLSPGKATIQPVRGGYSVPISADSFIDASAR